VKGISFPLKTWLLVDAYTKIANLVLAIILIITIFKNRDAAAMMIGLYKCFAWLFSVFSLAWFIIGAIMFWGNYHPDGTCD
jgi:uncharacterized membrane protein